MIVRKASRKDLSIVRDLALQIFPQTYAHILAEPQLKYMLDMMYSVASLEAQVASGHVFLLAQEGDAYVGYASYELNNAHTAKTKLHKIYVLSQTQGKGIGKKLLGEVEQAAKLAKSSHLILNVNRNNHAQAFYNRLGFHVVGQEDIDIGNGYLMEDFVMEKPMA